MNEWETHKKRKREVKMAGKEEKTKISVSDEKRYYEMLYVSVCGSAHFGMRRCWRFLFAFFVLKLTEPMQEHTAAPTTTTHKAYQQW